MYCKYAIQSEYTDIFATKVEMNSEIKQTADEINLEVRKKVDENEVISKINQSAEAVTIDASKININGTVSANGNFKVDTNGNMECNNAQINGGKIQLNSSTQYNNFIIGNDDNYEHDFTRMNGTSIELYDRRGDNHIRLDFYTSTSELDRLGGLDIFGNGFFAEYRQDLMSLVSGNQTLSEKTYIRSTGITTPSVSQTSLEESKKNFEKLQDNALETIKGIDIYKYNLKNEKDTDKKHIGFIIGDNYNYSKEVTSTDNQGVDNYSFTSLCCKAIQELTAKIEELENKIKEMEGK